MLSASESQYVRTLSDYHGLLRFYQQWNDQDGEGTTLSKLGELFVKQNQPELAIVFYKQSVNVRESIRREIQVLPREVRQSYTRTVADTYRALADLLLKQNRVLEAQQVLDLLKVQELEDYLHTVRGTTGQGYHSCLQNSRSKITTINTSRRQFRLVKNWQRCKSSL